MDKIERRLVMEIPYVMNSDLGTLKASPLTFKSGEIPISLGSFSFLALSYSFHLSLQFVSFHGGNIP